MWGSFEETEPRVILDQPRVDQPTDSECVVEFARKRLQFEPDDRQAEVLRSAAKRGILNCTRQWGKSTVAAAMAVYRLLTLAGCLVLVASPSERQSAELVRKVAEMLAKLGIRTRGDGNNAISLVLPNGSRIVGLRGRDGTIRGYSKVSLLLIDEAAQVEDRIYQALCPMLAVSDGDLWLMSTPYGKRGFFYESWVHGGPDWMRVHVPATECGRIGKRFLEEQRRTAGDLWFRQEYMGEFVDNGAGIFDRDLVEAALDEEVETLAFR